MRREGLSTSSASSCDHQSRPSLGDRRHQVMTPSHHYCTAHKSKPCVSNLDRNRTEKSAEQLIRLDQTEEKSKCQVNRDWIVLDTAASPSLPAGSPLRHSSSSLASGLMPPRRTSPRAGSRRTRGARPQGRTPVPAVRFPAVVHPPPWRPSVVRLAFVSPSRVRLMMVSRPQGDVGQGEGEGGDRLAAAGRRGTG